MSTTAEQTFGQDWQEDVFRVLKSHDVKHIVFVPDAGHSAAIRMAHGADLDLCTRHQNVIGVLLPKAEAAEQVRVIAATGKPVWPIIESAKGIASANAIAAASAVERLSFGSLDLAVDMRLTTGSQAAERILNQARFAVLLATKIAGLAPASDGAYPSIQDTSGLQDAVRDARNMGFGGALCIHPQARFLSSTRHLLPARKNCNGPIGSLRLQAPAKAYS